MTPTVGSSRKEGLIAATPQKDAGRITDPPVWVPMASAIIPAATAAATAEAPSAVQPAAGGATDAAANPDSAAVDACYGKLRRS